MPKTVNLTESLKNIPHTQKDLNKAMEGLSPQAKKVIDLKNQGWTYQEIAEEEGITYHAAISAYQAPVRKIRMVLRKK